jgi:signal peptidase I
MGEGKHIRTLTRKTLGALLLLALAFGAYQAGSQYLRFTVVHGISMLPTYRTNDLLSIQRAESYRLGDVISYHPAELPCKLCNVVHRIVGGDATGGFITKGDNNQVVDGFRAKPQEIAGKVVARFVIPGWAQMIYMPRFWILVASASATLFLALKLWADMSAPETTNESDCDKRQRGKHRKAPEKRPRFTFDFASLLPTRLPIGIGLPHHGDLRQLAGPCVQPDCYETQQRQNGKRPKGEQQVARVVKRQHRGVAGTAGLGNDRGQRQQAQHRA